MTKCCWTCGNLKRLSEYAECKEKVLSAKVDLRIFRELDILFKENDCDLFIERLDK